MGAVGGGACVRGSLAGQRGAEGRARTSTACSCSPRLIVIGGGAAGHFAAINAREAAPRLDVEILEAGRKPLEKVRISGGGRCNVTTANASSPLELAGHYPRGTRELR